MSSLDTKTGRRKTVNMSEDVAQELNRLANKQGKTLFSLVNEIGMQALEANKRGFSLEEALKAKKLVESARRSRMVLVNQDLWYFASSRAMRTSKTEWLKLVRNCAQWEANVYLTKEEPGDTSSQEFVESLRRFVSDYFWDCGDLHVDKVEGRDGKLLLRLAFVPEMPMEHTQTLFKAFEGMCNAFGYVATESTVEPGFFVASFRKIEGSGSH